MFKKTFKCDCLEGDTKIVSVEILLQIEIKKLRK